MMFIERKLNLFLNSSEKFKVFSSFSWLFLDKILRMGLGLIIGVWQARYLGPNQYGFWNYVVAFVGLFAAFATMGIDSLVVKELINKTFPTKEILGTAFVIRVLGSIVTFILSILSFYLFNKYNLLALEIIAITSFTFLFQSFDVIDLFFQSKVQSKKTVLAKNIAFLIFSFFRLFLIINKFSLMSFVLSNLFEVILGEIILIFFGKKYNIIILNWTINRNLLYQFFCKGGLLLLTNIMILLYMKIDQIMLGKLSGQKAVGIYSAAVRISEIWYFIPLALMTSIYPNQVQSKKESQERYMNVFKQLFHYFAIISIVISLLVAVGSNFIIRILFGQAFYEAGSILAINIWAGIFVCFGLVSSQFLVIEEFFYKSLFRTFIGAVSNIILNIFLIPKLGGKGAAVATLISYALSGFLLNYFDSKTRPIFYLQLKAIFFYDQIVSFWIKLNFLRKKLKV